HLLEPLDEGELTRCLRALADRAGEAGEPVRTILETEPGRLRALYALTGGNPRVLTMIYQLLERRESGDVFADLEALLDKVSPYYKARVEDYATAQQRAVIDAIALNWDPILSHDLSAKAGVEITTVSTHLHRLKRDGFIEEVQTSGARAGYQIAERFLNIWYLMRHGTRRTRQRLAGLAAFFARLYTPPELGRLARLAHDAETSRHWLPHYREGLIEAERLVSSAEQYSSAPARSAAKAVDEASPGFSEPKNDEVIALLSEAHAATAKGDRRLALRLFDQLIANIGDSPGGPQKAILAHAMVGRGYGLGNLGRGEEAIGVYDAIDVRFGEDGGRAVRAEVAGALFNKGAALGELGRREAEIAAYDALDARFGADDEPAVRAAVVAALLTKGITLNALGRPQEAIAVYADLDARFGADGEPTVRTEYVRALVYQGNLELDLCGDLDAAERGYRRALLLDPGSEPARANLAWLAIMAGRADEASALAAALPSLPPAGRALLDAALALAKDNFGSATGALGEALTLGLTTSGWDFFDDLLRLLRLADTRGHGERLIGWFETSGFDIKYAPVHAAFLAMVRGERFLRDVNPEVRGPARLFYERLTAPRLHAGGAKPAPKSGRGRGRKT
ncbi:MAG: hypothetical protein ABSG83_17650, partial [Roseiarcus sp.]